MSEPTIIDPRAELLKLKREAYTAFLRKKIPQAEVCGFEPLSEPHPALSAHARDIAQWAIRGGRRAIFANFGLHKTRMNIQLAKWITEKTGGKYLIVAPLGVRGEFTLSDGPAMDCPMEFARTTEQAMNSPHSVIITNYDSVVDGKMDVSKFAGAGLDEAACFPAGTLVDTPAGKFPIELIPIRHPIFNANGTDIVRAKHKNNVKRVARIHVGGNQILTSHDHKFLTDRGWVPASALRPGDCLVETTAAMSLLRGGYPSNSISRGVQKVLQSVLRSEMANPAAELSREDWPEELSAEEAKLRVVQGRVHGWQRPDLQAVLQPDMLRYMAHGPAGNMGESPQSERRCKERQISECLVENPGSGLAEAPTGNHELNGKSGFAREDEKITLRTDIPSSWWQRNFDEAADTSVEGIRRFTDRVCDRDGSREDAVSVASELLQGGHRNSGQEDCYRGGRKHSPSEEVEVSRPTQNGSLERTRVDGVEILESGHPDLDRYRDADGELYFYDLSATWHPSYSVAGFLVHNCLRSYGSVTYQSFLKLFKAVKYRFVFTATPSPNRYKELIHYSAFLGIMDSGDALTRFFQRDSSEANNLTLMKSQEPQFYMWLHSWALFITKPSDLGHSDAGYDLPPMRTHWHVLEADHRKAWNQFDSWGQAQLLREDAQGLKAGAEVKRESIALRVAKTIAIVEATDDQAVIWCDLNEEQMQIERALKKAGITFSSLTGAQDIDTREDLIGEWKAKKTRVFLSKPVMYGAGVNLQQCHTMIFVGVGYKFADFIQGVHRVHRFQQRHSCDIHIIHLDSESTIADVLKTKWQRHDELMGKMTTILQQHRLSNTTTMELIRTLGCERTKARGDTFKVVHNDCVCELQTMPDNCVDHILTSIPFGTQYEYSPTYNDFGHNPNNAGFFEQMGFLTPELLRVLRPGRIAAIHVKDRIRFGNVTGDGFPTVEPFSDHTVAAFTAAGFRFVARITIDTDVVRENNQTYRLGWSENAKDSSKMGAGMPEYVLIFRKLPSDQSNGYADTPVRKSKEDYTRADWQIDAAGLWRDSGNRLPDPETLKHIGTEELKRLWERHCLVGGYDHDEHVAFAKALEGIGKLPSSFMLFPPISRNKDVWTDIVRMQTLNAEQSRRNLEMHVCPLQLGIIKRLITRYTNEGEIVFDPFAGIGSVPFQAIKMGRKGWGVELNLDYWKCAVDYCERAEAEVNVPTLFDLMSNAPTPEAVA